MVVYNWGAFLIDGRLRQLNLFGLTAGDAKEFDEEFSLSFRLRFDCISEF